MLLAQLLRLLRQGGALRRREDVVHRDDLRHDLMGQLLDLVRMLGDESVERVRVQLVRR